MTNEVVKNTQTTDMATNNMWGSEGIDSSDMIIPKIHLMQFISKLVTSGVAKAGEFRDSMETSKCLGGEGKPVDMIFFGSFKTWWVFTDGEYTQTVKFGPTNSHWEREATGENGEVITRTAILHFYGLTTKDIKEGMAFPYVVSFKSSSYMTGKKLATYTTKLGMMGKPLASKVFSLGRHMEENKQGKYFVFDVEMERDATKEELEIAHKWHLSLTASTSTAKVHEDDDEPITKTTKKKAAKSTTAQANSQI